MRILLVQNAPHLPALGGANKHNRLLLEFLAARGHDCAVVALGSPEVLARAPGGGTPPPAVVSFRLAGVEVDAVIDGSRLREHLVRRIDAFAPDRVLVSSEDPAQALLAAALAASPCPVVYLAHTTLGLPCGPQAFLPSEKRTALLRRATAVLAASRYVAGYLRRWAGVETALLPIHFYPLRSAPSGDRATGAVTLINPCAVKGISIFLALARHFSATSFAAVPTWGTTAADRAALAALPNVTLLAPSEDIGRIFARARVLLVPSLWAEAFGGICVEAMLCGIPVLASAVGGLPEAMLGVPDLLPVRPVERYLERLDDRGMPVAEVPPQDVGPWLGALGRLLEDPAHDERRSRQAQAAAGAYVAALDPARTEAFLAALAPVRRGGAEDSRPAARAPAAGVETAAGDELRRRLDRISPAKLELLKRRLQKSAPTASPSAAPAAIARQPRHGAGDAFPLSFAQQRLWLLHRIDAGSASYNEFLFARLKGALRPAALAAALAALVARHELLRTRYAAADGEPRQIVDPPGRRPLPVACLRALPDVLRDAEMERLARRVARWPIDLELGPVLRTLLLQLREDEHVLVVVVHHIAADHWAITIALRELSTLYEAAAAGRPADLPPLPIQYADFAVHERRWLAGPVLQRFLDAWRRDLAGAPPVLDLPSDRPRPAQRTPHGARARMALTPAHTAVLRERARAEGVTLFMLLLAGLQALLHRLTGREDLVLGTPVAGRNRVETECLIGYFLNVLPLRGRPRGGQSFRDLLGEARRATLDAFARQELPFERLVEDLAPERSLSISPLFQTLLNFQNVPAHTRRLADLELTPLPIEIGIAKFDLDLYLEELDQALAGSAFYSTDLFDAATVERMMRCLAGVLVHAAARPEERLDALPLLTAAECHQVVVEWNDSAEEPGAADLPALVAAQAARAPRAVAVTGGGDELTYHELATRAGGLARRLKRLGVGPEVVVGLAVERSPDLVVALLGILAAGGAYLPLDASYPRERLAQMLADACPAVLVATDARTAERFVGLSARAPRVLCLDREREAIAHRPEPGLPDGGAAPDNLAYVLFTSGSTGRPKGVQIPRRALLNFLLSMRRAPGCAAGERLLAVTSLTFDIAALEIFLPLLAGGTVDLVGREEAADPHVLAARMAQAAAASAAAQAADDGAWIMQSTPATWRMLVAAGWAGDRRLRALCGGEALPPDLAAALAERVGELWNLYGPTETTVWSSRQRLGRGEPVTIGRPIGATSLHVVDAAGAPAPVGVPGELLIGGLGLARGYLGRPDLTAASFVPAPSGSGSHAGAAGSRLYRTGDLARTLPDGRIEHLGRRDHQVKVRGFRIETAEVELALSAHPGIAQAVVGVRHDPAGAAYLAAWVVPSGGAAPAPRELHAFLAVTLPEYMIPSRFVPLAELPLTANRKVDRRALPDRPPAGAAVFAPPATALEATIAAVFREVLGGDERIGRHDSFFELGGHSLLATQAVSRLRRSLEVDLPVRALFEAPTVAALAVRVDAARAAGRLPLPPIPRADRARPLPLSSGQRRLWFLDQLVSGSAAYNVPVLARLDGALDETALWRSLDALVARHEALRTRFAAAAGEPRQEVAPAAAWPRRRVELGALPAARREGELARLGREEAARPFDLARGPLYRGALCALAPDRQALVLVLHHIVCDGWSLGVLLDELGALYGAVAAGEPCTLPELAVQYADFAVWQQSPAAQERRAGDLAFWRRQLAAAPALLALPTDRPREAARSSAGQAAVRLPPARRAALQLESRRQGVTPFMLLLAAFQALLGRWSGQLDVLVGAPVANRTRPELEGLIGFFVNTLVLRGTFEEAEPFASFLARVRSSTLAAFDHQDLPFEDLVAELAPARRPGHSPLVQVLLTLHDAPLAGRELRGGLRLTPVPVASGSAKLDLFLALGAEGDAMAGTLEYVAALYDPTTIERFVGHFETLVTLVSEPGATGVPGTWPIGELLLLTTGESRQVTAARDGHAPLAAAVASAPTQATAAPSREPLRASEEIIAGIWSELLGLSRVARTDSFFDLGGHSLLAAQLVSRLRSCFSVELPLRRVFDAPTLAELAAEVESRRVPGASPEPLRPLPRPERLPLSFAQERLWFFYQMAPLSTAFNINGAVELTGELDCVALAASLDAIARRHEVLRTRFASVDGEPRQLIGPPAARRLPVVDLGALAEPRRERELLRLAAAEGRRPFDLAREDPLRVQLLRRAPRRHVALLSLHHIAGDGWSMAILQRELGDHYAACTRAAPPPAPALGLQYADYALWQRRQPAGEEQERQLAYWRRQLRSPLPVLHLPLRQERPDTPRLEGAMRSFRLTPEGTAALHELSRREGATLFMTLLAAYLTLLHGVTGQEDIVVGTNVANRNRTEVEGLIGIFVNNLALRTDLSGDPSFRELLARVRSVTLDAYDHQDVVFEKVIAEVEPRRQGRYSPLFQTMLVLDNFPLAPRELPGLEIAPLVLPSRTANFELILSLAEGRDGLDGRLTYDADLFDAATMARWVDDFVALLGRAAADPDLTLSNLLLDAEPVESVLAGSFNETL